MTSSDEPANTFPAVVERLGDATGTVGLRVAGRVLLRAAPWADRLRPGERVTVDLDPAAILVHVGRPTAVSAENVVPAVIDEIVRGPTGCDVWGRLRVGLRFKSRVTAAKFEDLGLEIGARVYLLFSAHAVRVRQGAM